MTKFMSRKWIAMVVGVIYSIVAMAGYQLPVEEVAVVDGILAVYMFVEGIVDIARAKSAK